MSPKELLYIEDALGHEKQIEETCTNSVEELRDEDLKNFVSQIKSKHEECFGKFMNLLN